MTEADHIHFVLVEPRMPGNIGASARALKNMGFGNLTLIDPPPGWEEGAKPMACQAGDVLKRAAVHPSLSDAVRDKALVIGMTRRTGKERGLFLPLREGLDRIRQAASDNPVAILFGREPSGLTNEELESCGFLMALPSAPEFPTLNLAQSVMLTAYELYTGEFGKHRDSAALVGRDALEELFERLGSVLFRLGYRSQGDRDLPASILRDLRRIFGRAGLTEWELKMLHGLVSRINDKIEP